MPGDYIKWPIYLIKILFLTILLSGVSTQFFKHIIGRPRPFLYNGYEKISLDLLYASLSSITKEFLLISILQDY